MILHTCLAGWLSSFYRVTSQPSWTCPSRTWPHDFLFLTWHSRIITVWILRLNHLDRKLTSFKIDVQKMLAMDSANGESPAHVTVKKGNLGSLERMLSMLPNLCEASSMGASQR